MQAFGEFDIANISCPVLAVKAAEDDLLGGQEQQCCSQLTPEVLSRSLLLSFNASRGGALLSMTPAALVS